MTFKDHFSERAALYAAYRPLYPDSLFATIAKLTPHHRTVLDSGTGNGQAAIGLASTFERVVATDPSAKQISRAAPHPRIEYKIAPAESSGLPDASVDLVTAAQALHWFDADSFFVEAKRVLVPSGAIAVWGYGDPILDSTALDTILHTFNRELLESYWPPERDLVRDGYRAISFPFDEVQFPAQHMEMRWTLPEITGYMRSWSATAQYFAKHGVDPVIEIEEALAREWGDLGRARLIRWPLYLRAGRVPS
ncbi:MAG: class I SAM-dependent methyltransferase [Gemmatimonadota bacterium]|nr:class I SAM-dependent methyltransferase [Gemmatimonadota bacterium]